jgi:dihydroxyacetone kinase
MKKIINDPSTVVVDSLRGMAAAHPDLLRITTEPAVVARADAPVSGKVGIVSGGGSGHEPMHGGFVGPGMLDAAVPGAVFTSPTPDAIQAAIQAVDGGAGVLLLVKNYTGDVLNFETAAELAEADGTPIRSVVIDDDVAEGLDLHGRPSRCRRHGPAGEDRRRGRGARRRPGPTRTVGEPCGGRCALDGHGPDGTDRATRRRAEFRPRR